MGCYNGTCNISNLPIFAGEKVVLIPLIKYAEDTAFNCCYPTDNFSPLGFPIVGKYDDYGGIEDIEILPIHEKYFTSLDFVTVKNNDAGEKQIKRKTFESFERFVQSVLCCCEGYYINVKGDFFRKDALSEINFMMVHYDLYMQIIEEMGARLPYGKTESYRELLTQKYQKASNKYKQDLVKSEETRNENVNDKEKLNELVTALKEQIVLNVTEEVFGGWHTPYNSLWYYYSDILLSDADDRKEVIDKAVKNTLFTTALNYMRKGYLCDSGCGSQNEETRLHVLLADFIKSHVEKMVTKRYKESSYHKAEKNGIREHLFFFDR